MDRPINEGRPFLGSQSGLTRRQFRGALDAGLLRRVFRGMYVDNLIPDSRQLRIDSVKPVMPSHGVLCGCSAGWVMGLDVFPPGRRFDFTPECLVPIGTGRSRSPLISCRRALIDPSNVMETGGVLHTIPVRTVSDLLRKLRRPYALSAADTFAHAGLITPARVQLYLTGLKGFRGIVQARSLAELIEPKRESPGESWQSLRLVDAGFPVPTPQLVVTDRFGREIARIDNAYRAAMIAMEYNGREFHSLDEDVESDDGRESMLSRLYGWRLVSTDKNDILGTDPWFEIRVGELLGMRPILPRRW